MCAHRDYLEEIWIRTRLTNPPGTVNVERRAAVLLWALSVPLARSDVSTRILCRLFQMRTSALSEDSASCACRVARPQPRRSSVGQQSDGQYHSPAGRDGLPQVSPHASLPLCALQLSATFLKLRAAQMTPSAWSRNRNTTEVLSAFFHVTANGAESGGGFQGISLENTQSRSDTLLICSSC